jgi:hypothetical protein
MLVVMKNLRLVFPLIAISVCSGCLVENSKVCPMVVNPAIRIGIRVPEANGDNEWDGKVVIRDGDYIEVLAPYAFPGSSEEAVFQATGAPERPGVYSVSVRKTGYEDWVVFGVVVAKGDCGVVTQRLTANLIKK